MHHLGQTLRVAALIELVGGRMRALVDENYPAPAGGDDDAPPPGVLVAPRSGVLFRIDHAGLVEAARAADCTLTLTPALGDFAPAGSPLLRVAPPDAAVAADVTDLVELGPERTMNQDLAYGMRMLVDIAERGLSEPFLDPTTAVQAIDRLHDCLRQLVRRPFPDGRHFDDAGVLRLVVAELDWEGYVRLAFDEIREAGATSPQVPRRLAAAIADLLTVAPPDRRPPLERQRALLAAVTGAAPVADRQGIGSGPDMRLQGPPVALNAHGDRGRGGAPGP